MIIPNKHIDINKSLLGIGAAILRSLDKPRSVTSLWRKMSSQLDTCSFETFSLALDFLYTIDAIWYREDLLGRNEQ
jgi:hypothetical protein